MTTPRPASIAAFAALATLAVVSLSACQSANASGASAWKPGTSPGPVATSAAPSASSGPTASASPTPTATSTPAPVVDPALKIGSSGDAVRDLQQELMDDGYWLAKVDGKFGDTTRQAVWAIQKASGHKPTGVTDKATWKAIHDGVKPKPKSTSGRVIEVDLRRNLVMFVDDGKVGWVLHASTGGGYTYTSEGVTSKAITPKGHFHTYRVVDGPDHAPLGLLWRPRYFSGGVALHGDSEVPNYPASHGCVRVSDSAMDWVWAQNLDPIGTSVWVY